MEEIFNEYDVPDDTRQLLWEYYRVFASDVLIRFGEFNPEIGFEEHNGHDG